MLSGCFIVRCTFLDIPSAWSLTTLLAQDNLHSGPASPASLRAGDIDTLLPCSERDFDSGHEPKFRGALEDTQLAPENSALAGNSGRSLFASLIQIRHHWGTVAQRAMRYERNTDPWDNQSDFSGIAEKLKWWEDALPDEHTWNTSFLRGYGSVGQDMVRLRICCQCQQYLTRRRHILK